MIFEEDISYTAVAQQPRSAAENAKLMPLDIYFHDPDISFDNTIKRHHWNFDQIATRTSAEIFQR